PQDQAYSQGYANEAPQAADEDSVLPDRLRRQIVSFDRNEPAGTIVIDTANTDLYYVLGNGRAMRYGVGVGREGFTWSGVQSISRKAEWPDWH
ncbi:L,D-transpeptidase family protein, partial [Acinetobacter baumannii]